MSRAALIALAAAAAIAAWPAAAQKLPTPPAVEMVFVDLGELPKEARDTLVLIHKGGPFPYAKDGAVFGNREGRLPPQKRGYYKEYTVKTPGVRTRGARRIITGAAGEIYYTDDHYNRFRRVRE